MRKSFPLLFLFFYFLFLVNAVNQLCAQMPEASRTPIRLDTARHPCSPILRQKTESSTPVALLPVEWASTDRSETISFFEQVKQSPQWAIGPQGYFLAKACLTPEQIYWLASLPHTTGIEWIRKPRSELKQEELDLSLNEVAWMHHLYPSLAGTGKAVSVKEEAFDYADIDFTNRTFVTEENPVNQSQHATSMASIIGGGANSSPRAKGVAWDIGLTSSGFEDFFPDSAGYFHQYEITVQNHSYGTGMIENYYGLEALLYDAIVDTETPEVLHVFSAGNSGDQTPDMGRYQGLTGWANLTGQFKQSKNTLCVGAVDSLDRVVSMSSHGPAYDGRIKPEVVAFGKGGTSEAAAMVTGLVALLQEKYWAITGDPHPPADLIKAILINAAKDIGPPGPDFTSGYGSVRAVAACQAIEDKRFITGEIQAGELRTFPLVVTPGTHELKATLCWMDPAAEINASKALIHDLDLRLMRTINAQSESFLPLTLSSYPDPDSLAGNAVATVDTLNTIEQIVITSPVTPAQYELQVSAEKISQGAVSFSLTWSFEPENVFQWTFPTASDALIAGQKMCIRWKTNLEDSGHLAFRNVKNGNWTPLGEQVSFGMESYCWQAPDAAGLYQVEVVTPDSVFVSDTFGVSLELFPKVGFVCPDSILFHWHPVPGIDSFAIYRIGAKHMLPVQATKDTLYIEKNLPAGLYHYAVAPLIQQRTGVRSYGFNYTQQGSGCYIDAFYLKYLEEDCAVFAVTLGSLYQVSGLSLARRIQGIFEEEVLLSPESAMQFTLRSEPLQQGRNVFQLTIILADGSRISSEPLEVYYLNDKSILVFPNPAISEPAVHILFDQRPAYSLELLDSSGRLLASYLNPQNPQVVQVRDWPIGAYIIRVNYEDGSMEAGRFILFP